jgi:hypothetical protein
MENVTVREAGMSDELEQEKGAAPAELVADD